MTMDVSSFTISPYPIFLMSSVAVGLVLASVMLAKRRVKRQAILFALMLNTCLVFYLGLVFTFISNLVSGQKPELGFSSMGGALGIILGSFIIYKIYKDKQILQVYFTTIPLIYAISKMGCFFAGCCGGVTLPIQLIETITFAIIFIIMMILQEKIGTKKQMVINITTCALAKFGLDFLRQSHVGQVLSINQITCLIIIIATISIAVFQGKSKSARQN